MTLLAGVRDAKFAGVYPARGTAPIAANTKIWKGALCAIDANGRAIPGNTAANGAVKTFGVASATFDNLNGSEAGGAAGAIDAEVEYGVFGFVSAAGGGDDITSVHVGRVAYMVDDNVVALTDGGAAARRPAGVITEVRDGLVWVWVGPHVSALVSGAAL